MGAEETMEQPAFVVRYDAAGLPVAVSYAGVPLPIPPDGITLWRLSQPKLGSETWTLQLTIKDAVIRHEGGVVDAAS